MQTVIYTYTENQTKEMKIITQLKLYNWIVLFIIVKNTLFWTRKVNEIIRLSNIHLSRFYVKNYRLFQIEGVV